MKEQVTDAVETAFGQRLGALGAEARKNGGGIAQSGLGPRRLREGSKLTECLVEACDAVGAIALGCGLRQPVRDAPQ